MLDLREESADGICEQKLSQRDVRTLTLQVRLMMVEETSPRATAAKPASLILAPTGGFVKP